MGARPHLAVDQLPLLDQGAGLDAQSGVALQPAHQGDSYGSISGTG